jgi:hypothetical protein
MAGIFGILGLSDTERVFANTVGQAVVYDGITRLVSRYNDELYAALSVFVEEQTPDFKERYKLPGGGRLQRRGGYAPSAAVKAYGGYDVAYPLEDFGAQLADSDVAMAYMTIQDIDRHLDTIFIQDANTVRFELLKALLNNVQDTFVDPLHGSLSIEPLANGDANTYPPVLGSESEATEDHYLESGYAASAISDTNNPYITVRDELEHHFGAVQGGANIAAFINSAEVPETEALTDYVDLTDRFIRPGDNAATLFNLPSRMPGRLIGRTNGCWVFEWRWIPSAYLVAVDLDSPPPLKLRIDPPNTGLGRGLKLVARDEAYPLELAHYRHRFGLGCGNRLNGVVMEFGSGGSYSIPSGYS